MFDYSILQAIWWVLVIVLLSGFVIFDGFDLGALCLNPFISKTDEERRVVINTIAPHWDGNQVWLLLGGGAIFAAWPEVYATSFSGFYIAMILILAALFFRPVGLEYRGKFESATHRKYVDWALWFAGFVPSLVVGVALGNTLLGVPFYFDEIGRSFYGDYTFFLWNLIALLNPFSIVCGLISFSIFMLQGALWVMLRTDKNSDIYKRAKIAGFVFFATLAVASIVACIWLMYIPGYQVVGEAKGFIFEATQGDVVREATWFANYNNHLYLYLIPVLALVAYIFSFNRMKANCNGCAFFASSLGVILTFTTFAITLFPFILPSSKNPAQSLTVWNATSSQFTLQVMFYVAIIFVPTVLAYTGFAYYKMWARLSTKEIENNTHTLY